MKSKNELIPISLEEAFPGKTAEQVLEESHALERKYLKAWYTPFDNLMRIAENSGAEVKKCKSKGPEKAKFCDGLNKAENSFLIGSGSVNCDLYCKDEILASAEDALKKGLKLELLFGGFLMTQNGKNEFLDDILLSKHFQKNVHILYFPYRLAFHSNMSDLSEVTFHEFHYEISSIRHHYSLNSCIGAVNFLNDYYRTLEIKFKAKTITKDNSDLIKRKDRSFFFDMNQILATEDADKMI